ncbi:MAG: hypothetical protein Q8858_16520 [Bacteroidota bacterium]|nr:hypothetical protein [Bacteroidota bacterium]
MKRLILLIIVSFLQACFSSQKAQEKNVFSGQLSAWGHYNNENSLPVGFGVRYIPDIS